MILFKEKMGSCTTKHAVIATLAEELKLPVQKNIIENRHELHGTDIKTVLQARQVGIALLRANIEK